MSTTLTPEQERHLRSWLDVTAEQFVDALRDLRANPTPDKARTLMLVARTVGRVTADLATGLPPRNLTLPGVTS